MPPPRQKFFDANGVVLAGGSLYSYAAGTTTPLATYTDQTEGGTNANPVVLDSNGEAVIWLGSNSYKFVLKDSLGNTIWTVDNVKSINNSSITLGMIPDGLFTADAAGRAKIADGFVNAAKLGAKAVGTAAINDAAVGTTQMADGSVTPAKRASLGQQVSSSCGTYTTTSNAYADVTNLSVTITTTGRPIFIGLIPDGGSNSKIGATSTTTNCGGFLKLLRGVSGVFTLVAQTAFETFASGTITASQLDVPALPFMIDVQGAGTYTYKYQAAIQATGNSQTVYLNNLKLVAFEL